MISDVAIDLMFWAMELKIETALGIGDGSDIEQKRFPVKAVAPDETFKTQIKIGTLVDEKLHHGAAVILVAVDGVE